jgi:hypothetical protein
MNQSKRTETSSDAGDHIPDAKKQILSGYDQQKNDDCFLGHKQANVPEGDACISVQPKIKSVVIRSKESPGSEDQEDSSVQRVHPASPFVPHAREAVGELESHTNDSTMRELVSGPVNLSGKNPGNGSDTLNNSHGDIQNLGPGGMFDIAKTRSSETKNMEGSSMGDAFKALLVSSEGNDPIVTVAPTLTPVVLSSSGATSATSHTMVDRSPKPPRRSMSKRSDASEANNGDRLKRANELIQQQKQKKEASRSRQMNLDDHGSASSSREYLESTLPPAGCVILKSTTTSSPGQDESTRKTPGTESSDRIVQLETISPRIPEPIAKLKGLKSVNDFVSKTRRKRENNRQRRYGEETTDTNKPTSSKWKNLSTRLKLKTAPSVPSHGADETASPSRVSKWAGLKTARDFIGGNARRQTEQHRHLLDDM